MPIWARFTGTPPGYWLGLTLAVAAPLFGLVAAPVHPAAFAVEELSEEEARRALRRARQPLRAATQQQDTSRVRQLHWYVGQAWFTLRQPAKAARHYRQALDLSAPRSEAAAWSEWLLGQALLSQGDTGQARQAYQRALATFQRRRVSAGQGRVLEQLGELYGHTTHWYRAQLSYEQALATWQTTHDAPRAARVLARLGAAHRAQHQYSRALYYLQQSSAWAHQQPDSLLASEVLTDMGLVYQMLRNVVTAHHYYQHALSRLPATAPPRQRAELLRHLGTTADSLDQAAAAGQYLRAALGPARQAGSYQQLAGLYQALSSLYRREHQPEAALAALQRYTQLQDSAYAEQHLAQVAELQTRFETVKKEKEIQLLRQQRELQRANLRRQTLLRNLLAAGALLLLLAVVVLYRQQRRQRRTNRLLELKNAAISRQKEELDRLNQTKNTLFSIISHDLRGPLTSLHSLVALLKLGRLPADRLTTHSERLTRMLDSTLHLLDNLLNWSASQLKGSTGARAERIRLEELVEETVALFQGDADRKGIQLRTELPTPCLARADVNMMRLVLRNLLSNALKFTPSGGWVHLAAERRGSSWEISVQDTGVGIDARNQARLLENGHYFSTPGTAREKGTGLGLPLCREFVQRNGGEFWFRSQPGAGTAFHFTLPAIAEGEALPADGPVTAQPPRASAAAE